MKYEDMSDRERRLFRKASCPICKKHLDRIDDVQLLKVRHGRAVVPFYIHTSCLLSTLLSSQLDSIREEVENVTV